MPHGFELFWVTQKQQISHPPYLFESLISVAHHQAYPAQATLPAGSWDIPACHIQVGLGAGEGVLLAGIRWVEGRGATKYLQCTNNFSQQRIIQLKMSTVSEKPQFTEGKQT